MSKIRLQFTAEQLRDAVLAVRSGESLRNAAKLFGIPPATLFRRLKCPFPNRSGPPTSFSKEEEDTFATLLKGFEAMDLALTRRKFIGMVKAEAKRKGLF